MLALIVPIVALAALWLFAPGLSRRIRGVATILLWCAAHLDGIADAVDDLLPHWFAGLGGMARYARQRAKGYLAEVR